jgi:CRISPR/Cas system type I-B associated protein Csh2 (Cas7 group RAMP superfamily)
MAVPPPAPANAATEASNITDQLRMENPLICDTSAEKAADFRALVDRMGLIDIVQAEQAEADTRLHVQNWQNVDLRGAIFHQSQGIMHQGIGSYVNRRIRHDLRRSQRANVVVVPQGAADISVSDQTQQVMIIGHHARRSQR